MRRRIAFAFLLLAACGQNNTEPAANQTAADANSTAPNALAEANTAGTSSNEPVAAPSASASENRLGTLPPADAELRFVGVWAANKAECASKGWRFTADRLTVPGGPHCSFYKVDKAPGGYDIAAQCPTKEPIHTDLIKLRFAESARAMLVESNAIEPHGLIYCGK